ncbi:HNH endonuclease [Arthrobacter citreus]|uniref:HNH endonuclease n=1 Tax=Arthrobacter citreus TaxID=1670 RepID=UPI003CCA9368
MISEIDHTKPWAQGGATDHDNLEYLCRRHHMFKTQGFWKACQPVAGIIEWTSPGGRTYRTEPHLALAPVLRASQPDVVRTGSAADTSPGNSDDDYGGDPPPF